jgi:hypothetical protein
MSERRGSEIIPKKAGRAMASVGRVQEYLVFASLPVELGMDVFVPEYVVCLLMSMFERLSSELLADCAAEVKSAVGLERYPLLNVDG